MNEQRDWRIGLAVTPKMRDHSYYKTVWIVRAVLPETENIKEQLRLEAAVEYGHPAMGKEITEPSDDWMTA